MKLDNKKNIQDEKERAKIFDRFGGLPQGLKTVKNFCIDHNKTYSGYLDLIEKFEYLVYQKEKEAIANEFGKNVEHLFEAIVFSFTTLDESDPNDVQFKILSCLSYFHIERIPESVITHCHEILCKNTSKNKEANKTLVVGKLITCFCERDMCCKNNKNELVFNDVVMTSLRLHQFSTNNPHFFLKNAVKILHIIKTNNVLETDLLRLNVKSLLKHTEKETELIQCKHVNNMLEELKSVTSKKTCEKNTNFDFITKFVLCFALALFLFIAVFYFF